MRFCTAVHILLHPRLALFSRCGISFVILCGVVTLPVVVGGWCPAAFYSLLAATFYLLPILPLCGLFASTGRDVFGRLLTSQPFATMPACGTKRVRCILLTFFLLFVYAFTPACAYAFQLCLQQYHPADPTPLRRCSDYYFSPTVTFVYAVARCVHGGTFVGGACVDDTTAV